MPMYVREIFGDRRTDMAWDFIEKYRLGMTVISCEPGGLTSSPMPYLLDRTRGALGTLCSHVPLASPQHRAMSEGKQCLVVFSGPNGYISPSWFPPSGRSSAPTWNFSVVEVIGRPSLLDRSETARHIVELVECMENGRPDRWRLHEMGARFDHLLNYVAGFEIPVEGLTAKHKLGQDERPEDALAAIEHLARGTSGENALSTAMREVYERRS